MATNVNHLILDNGLAAGIFVQKCRQAQGLTQKQVDEKCSFYAGFTGRLERGELKKISIPDVYELESSLKGFNRSSFEKLSSAKLEIHTDTKDHVQRQTLAISSFKTHSFSKNKNQLKFVSKGLGLTVLIVAVAALWSWNAQKKHQEQVRIEAVYASELTSYKGITSNCLNISIEEATRTKGGPRSSQRINAVQIAYDQVYLASCIGLNQKYYWNPFQRVSFSQGDYASPTQPSEWLLEGAFWAIDSGLPFLEDGTTLCEDGSSSNSRGQGTCSWHGGYADPRGSPLSLVVPLLGEEIIEPVKPS